MPTNKADKKLILVVIPTLNEEKNIVTVIEQLIFDLPTKFRVRFIVADGGSSDGTVTAVELAFSGRGDVSVLKNPARIQSAAINLVVRTFGNDAELLVRCDAHASYPPGFIKKLVETAEREKADSVVVVMDSVGIKGFQNAVATVSDTFLGSGGSAHRGGARSGFVDHGHHALIRIDAFRLVGGYDETFTHNEDAEFDCRLRALGGTIYLDSAIRIAYSPRASVLTLSRQYYNYGRGRSRTVRKHPHSLRFRQLAVTGFLLTITILCPFSAWEPLVLIPGFMYIFCLAAASVYFTLKKRDFSCLMTGPAALVMHTAWASGFVGGFLTTTVARWRPDNGQTNTIN